MNKENLIYNCVKHFYKQKVIYFFPSHLSLIRSEVVTVPQPIYKTLAQVRIMELIKSRGLERYLQGHPMRLKN